MRLIVFILGMSLFTSLWAVQPQKISIDEAQQRLQEKCQEIYCRQPVGKLNTKDGDTYTYDTPLVFPVIPNSGLLNLYPGDELHIETEITDDGSVKFLRVVESSDKTENVWRVNFSQSEGQTMMLLSLIPPDETIVKFSMDMMLLNGKMYRTTSCPVQGRMLLESWPHPIYQIYLHSGRVLADDDDKTCKY